MLRSKRVRGPDGREWTVRRRWTGRPRWRGPFGKRILDHLDFLDFDLEGLLFFLALIAFVVFMVFVGVPLLIFLVESLRIVVVLFAGIVGRVVFRRPWVLEATANPPLDWPHKLTWRVVGWRASSKAATKMADLIRATGILPREPSAGLVAPRAHRRLPR